MGKNEMTHMYCQIMGMLVKGITPHEYYIHNICIFLCIWILNSLCVNLSQRFVTPNVCLLLQQVVKFKPYIMAIG